MSEQTRPQSEDQKVPRHMCIRVLDDGNIERATHFRVVDANDYDAIVAELQRVRSLNTKERSLQSIITQLRERGEETTDSHGRLYWLAADALEQQQRDIAEIEQLRAALADAKGPKHIEITSQVPGYAHTELRGTCGPDVTTVDIRAFAFHPIFGGRDAWVNNGAWGCIRHDD